MNRIVWMPLALCAAVALVGCGKKESAPAKPAPAKATAAPTAEEKPAAAAKAEAKPLTPEQMHDSGPVGDAKKGAAIYASKCVACHQKDGKGMGGALAADFVKDKSRLAKPDSVLLASIRDGKKGKRNAMPPQKGVLKDQEMKDVLAYVRATFGAK
ncbi:MAG: cytochrome c [Myxococcales bacterium]|nr:cytochrome c [Myxococcales bacterium]